MRNLEFDENIKISAKLIDFTFINMSKNKNNP
jgi:hypothetical protein